MLEHARIVTAVGLMAMAACTSDEPLPAPSITAVEPQAICPTVDNDPVFVRIAGTGFVVGSDHRVGSTIELWQDGHVASQKLPLLEPDLEGRSVTLVFRNGENAPAQNEPPEVFEVRVTNPDDQTAKWDGDFSIHSGFGFSTISPASASTNSTVTMNLSGTGFYEPMRVTIESQLSTLASQVQVTSPTSVTASFDLASVPPGTYAVTMRNAGGCKYTRVSAFTMMP